ncbi:MAG TPA: response regulator [Candidatus Sulfopaludibacter sp.]|nr:response regulator [Candidatus Sulfopaludibacter sp.]
MKLKIPFLADPGQEKPKARMRVNAPAQSAGAPAKILVVDDNTLFAKAIGLKLEAWGYQVVTALDSAEAISVARREKPDLILLDIGFPPDVGGVLSDGFRIMEWLHHVDESSKIPFIIVTGDSDAKNRERAMANGAVAFFQKPIPYDELLKVIRATLSLNAPRPV